MSKISDWLDRQDKQQEDKFIKERSVGQIYHNPFTKTTTYSSEYVRRLVNEQRIPHL